MKYNDQYYLAFRAYNENALYLKSLKKTYRRNYEYTQMIYGQAPLFFENGYKEKDIKSGRTYTLTNVLFNMNFIIVDDKIKKKLEHFEILNFQLYPAVIIDDDNKYHERYWFFNMYNKFSALDLDKSTIDDFEPEDRCHSMVKYYLSDEILDSIPEEQRLIFKEDKCSQGITIVHQKIVDIFNSEGTTAVNFIRVSDYEEGKEFRSIKETK